MGCREGAHQVRDPCRVVRMSEGRGARAGMASVVSGRGRVMSGGVGSLDGRCVAEDLGSWSRADASDSG